MQLRPFHPGVPVIRGHRQILIVLVLGTAGPLCICHHPTSRGSNGSVNVNQRRVTGEVVSGAYTSGGATFRADFGIVLNLDVLRSLLVVSVCERRAQIAYTILRAPSGPRRFVWHRSITPHLLSASDELMGVTGTDDCSGPNLLTSGEYSRFLFRGLARSRGCGRIIRAGKTDRVQPAVLGYDCTAKGITRRTSVRELR
ncbi:hypothetical protein PYCCODRAFT_439297 [Trametes coccinea BRFM310]|uniref:Secreted protein n=1 Tax=Trametes coccinea (strain BRFM310) TaxID=1353009 RepID=A0A1Y2ILQ5_TRAC3|nr:hypothetical protein PYCCODRAFT_439297 [Trametes coccinea BRFM310]